METSYITITELCNGYKIEHSYISSLSEYGLIEIERFQGDESIDVHQLPKLEKIMRFHDDLKINLEGIEVILNLLDKLESQKKHLQALKNRLNIYEEMNIGDFESN